MYTANPIPTLNGAAAIRFQQLAERDEARRGTEDYSEARIALQTILRRSGLAS
jgi:hypothetical protein